MRLLKTLVTALAVITARSAEASVTSPPTVPVTILDEGILDPGKCTEFQPPQDVGFSTYKRCDSFAVSLQDSNLATQHATLQGKVKGKARIFTSLPVTAKCDAQKYDLDTEFTVKEFQVRRTLEYFASYATCGMSFHKVSLPRGSRLQASRVCASPSNTAPIHYARTNICTLEGVLDGSARSASTKRPSLQNG